MTQWLPEEDKHKLELQTQTWTERVAQFGLCLNVKKTEYFTTDANVNGTVIVDGTDLQRTDGFTHLGSMVI
ncbi:hypothetical protein Y032_0007g3421 [Ancylostoma ceylanicum]|uniref:Reverse transcriptase domain-containing protein n=1 Tax=Ancylostoma ceylanicum TaxID=53326 RepID=A0A016VME2_9BILA|nr:hypothetical protein Y032_0007g3421 [Ancylostoma ceylanicum]